MNVKAKYIGLQTWCLRNAEILRVAGDYACYFFSLCSIADEYNESCHNNFRVDILCTIRMALDNKWIDEEFTVLDDVAILNYLTGTQWTKVKSKTLPDTIPDNMYTIAKWYRKTNVKKADGSVKTVEYTHFRRRWGDTLENSNTVKYGRIVEYRLFSHAA